MNVAYILGVDIGGTSIKAGLFDKSGNLIDVKKIQTIEIVNDVAYAMVVQGLGELLSARDVSSSEVAAIGMTVPGPVDSDGRVGVLANISLDAEGLKGALHKAFPAATVAFVNDANAAALGELWQGGAQGVSNCVMVTLGTGVGGGVIVDGHLVAGAFGAAGEIGHLTMNYEETQTCGCGRKGCLEQYASAKGIVRLYRAACERAKQTPVELSHETDTISVFKAYAAGDACAKEAIEEMSEYLGRALALIACVVDPEVVLIGGGVAGGYNVYAEKVTESFWRHCFSGCAAMRISAATLGNEAGMYGAAYCALQQWGK
jgi:glucokinase